MVALGILAVALTAATCPTPVIAINATTMAIKGNIATAMSVIHGVIHALVLPPLLCMLT